MGFLAPLFLLGIAAVAVPVLVHLVNRERRTVVHFPSLMFLEKVPHKSVRRRRIRHWALLALRCLVFAALAAAFARPLIRRADATAGVTGTREIVVLLDRSYSMGREGRWARAQGEARKALATLRTGDRATVVLFDDDASAATMPTAEGAVLRAAVDGARPGWGRTRYAPALRLAAKLLAESDRPRREVVLVSDFQRRAWESREEVRLPDGATLTWADVGNSDATADAAVAQVTLKREHGTGTGHDSLVAQARVTSTAACAGVDCGAPRKVPVTLTLAGRTVETKTVTLPANGVATVDFAPVPVPAGSTRGTVHLPADALTRDDTSYFVVSPAQDLSVLVLEPSGARANQSLYLRRALELATEPAVRVEVRPAERAIPSDLDGRALVVLNDAASVGSAFAKRLDAFVEQGGGLLAALGTQGDAGAGLRSLLALTPGAVVDRGAEGGRLATVDLSHPALEPFATPRGGDFATARVLRYRAATLPAGATALARWDDGGVALAERHVGRGMSLAFASTFDTYWNDLALQPVWVPLVHRLARHAAHFSAARSAYVVGELLDAPRVAGVTSTTRTPLVAESPSGRRVPVGDSTGVARAALALGEAGFWVLRPEGGAPGTGTTVAVNVDPAEADPARVEPETIAAAASAPGATRAGNAALADLTVEEMEGRQMLWWWFLAAAMLALAAELVVGNRLSKRMR